MRAFPAPLSFLGEGLGVRARGIHGHGHGSVLEAVKGGDVEGDGVVDDVLDGAVLLLGEGF
jgi:hypothetical protein